MIIRAFPKYLRLDDFPIRTNVLVEDGLYFNSGSNAIQFLLKTYSRFLSRSLNVAIQSFNCSTVSEAILRSGNNVFLFDVKETDFSLDYNLFVSNSKGIDVVIITHYQGIPNEQYELFAEYCSAHRILLVDDMAQTEGSVIHGHIVGSLSHYSVHSFSFDKPYTCMHGGELKANQLFSANFSNLLKEEYGKLNYESLRRQRLDLQLLKFLLTYARNRYSPRIDYRNFTRLLLALRIPSWVIYHVCCILPILFLRVGDKVGYMLCATEKISRIRKDKLNLIAIQRERANGVVSYDYPDFIQDILNEVNHVGNVVWNRLSLVDRSGKYKNDLKLKHLEVGNFNWSKTLHSYYRHAECGIKCETSMKNTEFLCKNILNIPIWQYMIGYDK